MNYKEYFISIFFFVILFSCKDVNKISAGSYPYAEIYTINEPEKEVIKKIFELKENNPDYKVPEFQWAGKKILLEDKVLKNGYFVFYIFFKENNQILYSYVRQENSTSTKIGLISIQNGMSLGNWKIINKDLTTEENDQLKNIFKEKIISNIN